MTGWTMPVLVRGSHVSLEPLADTHAADLRAASDDGALWRSWYANVPAPDAIDGYIAAALAMRDAGTAFPFVVKDATGAVVGSTRYYEIDASAPRLSVGYTWYAQSAQRTGLNTEAKLLLLGHAFESLGCISVGLKTSWFNHASRAAIARLGAKQDGVLRSHQRHADGSVRDTVVFSIIASEWPAVKTNLLARLAAHA